MCMHRLRFDSIVRCEWAGSVCIRTSIDLNVNLCSICISSRMYLYTYIIIS
ncbi:hypothetical protein HanPI659440_Chr09g0321301 [Helianthus annuus]|nr:hypothetical protein HanPI659440_Chr09g0321301 [Helianthus annuus]